MPSRSPAQARLMAAVAHGWKKPGGGGPPMDVAQGFNEADAGGVMLRRGMKGKKSPQAEAMRKRKHIMLSE